MEVRDARSSDAEAIQRVARASFAASYDAVLDDAEIDEVVETDYAPDSLGELLDDEDTTVLVAADGEVVGFVQGHIVRGDPIVGHVHWLHVHPDERRQGTGVRLLGEIVDRFENDEATIVRGSVVEANESGGAFYEAHGFERRSTDSVDIAGETYDEVVYERRLDEAATDGVVEPATGPDGRELFVDYAGSERGNEAPFYPAFTDRSLEERYGWQCGNCESLETTMDASGRIRCSTCGNTSKATRWDGSYL